MNKSMNNIQTSNRSVDIQRLIDLLNSSNGIRVGDLKFSDVMFDAWNCHCIYAFCEGENYRLYEGNNPKPIKYWYIGSNVSGALVERLGKHFAPRKKDFANSLLKKIAYTITNDNNRNSIWMVKVADDANKRIEKAFPIMKDLMLNIICFEELWDGELKDEIMKTERELIKELKPAFNYTKRNGNRKFVIKDINGNPIKH